MADDVVRLAHQLVGREARGRDEVLVEVAELALQIGPGDDQRFIPDRIFDVGDGKVLSHGKPQSNRERIFVLPFIKGAFNHR